MPRHLTGRLTRIVYESADTFFTVAELETDEGTGPATVVGQLSGCNPGETLELSGDWETHAKYGLRFRAKSCRVRLPAGVEEIERYLASGVIKGIGPETARRLTHRFGESTLEVMEHKPKELLSVPGIGPKRLETIREAWKRQRGVRDVMIFLQGQGIGPAHSARILKHYGEETIRRVRENPYRLASDIDGIGFLTADTIARKVGIPEDSEIRAEAGLIHILEKSTESGNVYSLRSELLRKAEDLLGIAPSLLQAALERLHASRRIVIENLASERGEAVYLKAFHAIEQGLADRVKAFSSVPVTGIDLKGDEIEKVVHQKLAVLLSQEQWQALRTTLSSKLSIITGGPGTGKTTLLKAVLTVFERAGRRVRLCAPTGRAAKRLADVTGRTAETVHRLLAFDFKKRGFQRTEEDPVDADLVIADEASMIDLFLMHALLKAIPAAATLILVGDIHQLPSVGPGNVLRDLIDSGKAPTVYLTEIFRQARESLIVLNAHRINHGLFPRLTRPSNGDLSDFYLIEQDDPERVVAAISELCTRRIPDRFGLDPLSQIQVLTPMHKGPVGTANLNRVLQKALNPSRQAITAMGTVLREGDKVMQTRNNYSKEVFNGDIGKIANIDTETSTLTVRFDGEAVVYDTSELDELILAYAVSVHKSQGSEYAAVVMPVMLQHFVLLQRNLIYTGITRAKELVVMIGSKKALTMAIRNDTPRRRRTGLTHRLQMERSTRNRREEREP